MVIAVEAKKDIKIRIIIKVMSSKERIKEDNKLRLESFLKIALIVKSKQRKS